MEITEISVFTSFCQAHESFFVCLFVFVFCRVNRWTLILIYWTKGQECDDKKQIMLLYTICQQREAPGPRLMLKYHYVDANQTAKA